MTEKLIGALAENIRARFGEEYKVYTEKIEQDLVKPCFFVECESAEKVALLGGRFFLRVWIKVSVEAQKERKNYSEQKALGDLMCVLNSVLVEERRLLGRKIHTKYENGKMTLKGCYDIFFEEFDDEKEKGDLMERIEGGFKIG